MCKRNIVFRTIDIISILIPQKIFASRAHALPDVHTNQTDEIWFLLEWLAQSQEAL
ncbi:hypothetical protein ACVWXD_002903 [Pseudomonas sp. TE3911]|jgi:hypothetical protein